MHKKIIEYPEPAQFESLNLVLNFTWNINVHWYNSVAASDDSVGVVVVASSISAAGLTSDGGCN